MILRVRKATLGRRPIEAGPLLELVDVDDRVDRVQAPVHRALQQERDGGSPWQLVGLEISWEGIERIYGEQGLPPALPTAACRSAFPVYTAKEQVGQVTSSTWSPILKKYIALATIKTEFASPETLLSVEHTVEYERTRVPAQIVDRPFFAPPRKRS